MVILAPSDPVSNRNSETYVIESHPLPINNYKMSGKFSVQNF